jgi:hypothetical protein
MKSLFSLSKVIDFSIGFLISSVAIYMLILFVFTWLAGGVSDQISLR